MSTLRRRPGAGGIGVRDVIVKLIGLPALPCRRQASCDGQVRALDGLSSASVTLGLLSASAVAEGC